MLGVGAEGGEGVAVVVITRCVNLDLPASVIAIVTLDPTDLALAGHLEDFPDEIIDSEQHNGEFDPRVLPLEARLIFLGHALGSLDEADSCFFEAPDFDTPPVKLWQSFSNFYANILLLHASSMYDLR